MDIDWIRKFRTPMLFSGTLSSARPKPSPQFVPVDGCALDVPQVDSLDFLLRVSAFLPIHSHGTFRELCPATNARLRPRASLVAIIGDEHCDSPLSLKLFRTYNRPTEDDEWQHIMAKCDIECMFLYISKYCRFDLFARMPSLKMVKHKIRCESFQPGVLPFITKNLSDLDLCYKSDDTSKSYPFGLQDVLDRIGRIEDIALPVCRFTDSANWKEIMLPWIAEHKYLYSLHLDIADHFTQAELDSFLEKILPHVCKYRYVGIGLPWSKQKLLSLKNTVEYAPKRYLLFV